jgi:phosphoribosylglycinamide formyltransferase-1
MANREGCVKAAFVSEDPRLLKKLGDKFDLVISDRDDLKHLCEDKFLNLEHDEDRIAEVLKSKGVSTAISLGYRRLFSEEFLEQVECEIYNLHPSILPAFKGLDVYERVIDRGVEVSGATLHRVEPEMDEGEIIDQITYRVREDMNVEELKKYAAKYEAQLLESNIDSLM